MPNQRDITIDTLRGIAVFTMLAANLAGMILAEPHPFGLRLYGSFAAPLFILLAGMTVGFTVQAKGYGLKKFLQRGLTLLMTGILLDLLLWRIYPLTTVDVLYLIAVSLPIAYLFLRLKPALRWALIIALFLITPWLQRVLGYTDYPSEFDLSGEISIAVTNQTGILNHWLIDGWFPVFPWLGFALLGANLAAWREVFSAKRFLVYSLTLLSGGIIIWQAFPGAMLTRDGYSELFYPPTLGFSLTALAVIFLLFYIVDKTKELSLYKPFRMLGQSSLLVYVLHLIIINFLIEPFWPETNLTTFFTIYLALSLFLTLIAFGVNLRRQKFVMRICI
ncbi:MAG: DUF1624 domain-containing protein [Candidatus Schekmanbacteria bacterium]|nr:DUF1624 domain-containing protein [Candidatus Schekmanbacteria bacterium]